MSDLQFSETDILIDQKRKNKTLKGWNEQEYEIFQKNKNKVNLIYLERDIEYKYNDKGYRTKNISNLDKQFALVFGCSHTEGIGNFEEHIWCSQLLTKKGLDFLNLGKASTGPDIQYLNSLQWIKNNFPLPKIVIYQWPQTFRKSFAYQNKKDIILKHHNVHTKQEKRDTDWYLKRYCFEPGEMTINNYVHYMSANLLWEKLNIPVLNWSWTGDFERSYDSLHLIETVDTGRARDLMHDGPDIHQQVADKLRPLLDNLI
jgi:hypothetical protein